MKKFITKGGGNLVKVVERIKNESGVVLERYEDGDCLLTPGPAAYIQLSATLIARLAQPVQKSNTHANITGENNDMAVTCSVRKIAGESGWQSTLRHETGHVEVHVYATRDQARRARPGTQVGNSGRIA